MAELGRTRAGMGALVVFAIGACVGVWCGPWQGAVRALLLVAVAGWAGWLIWREWRQPLRRLHLDGDPVLDGVRLRGGRLELWGPWLLLHWRDETGRLRRACWWPRLDAGQRHRLRCYTQDLRATALPVAAL